MQHWFLRKWVLPFHVLINTNQLKLKAPFVHSWVLTLLFWHRRGAHARGRVVWSARGEWSEPCARPLTPGPAAPCGGYVYPTAAPAVSASARVGDSSASGDWVHSRPARAAATHARYHSLTCQRQYTFSSLDCGLNPVQVKLR